MQNLQAVIMGMAQGITEFLPVSSSGHIVLSSAIYKIFTGANFATVQNEEIFFDILVHLATLFAVIIYFFKDLKNIFLGFLKSLFNKNFEDKNFKFGIYILAATFITCVMGLFIKDFAHKLTENPFLVSIFLMITGIILFVSEKFKGENREIDFKLALLIGFFQGLAIFPGVSRSGMTISSAVFKGVNRVEAAKFSFILSVPIILIASFIYPLMTFDLSEVKDFNLGAIALGMLVSFVSGYICIKYFMKFLQKNSLKVFAFYCFIVGGVCTILFYFVK